MATLAISTHGQSQSILDTRSLSACTGARAFFAAAWKSALLSCDHSRGYNA
jgi:hypothetical protein